MSSKDTVDQSLSEYDVISGPGQNFSRPQGTLWYSTIKTDHLYVIFLLKPPFSSGIFRCQVWLPEGINDQLSDFAQGCAPWLPETAA